jgi:RND family efflux transporter MFP subunit
MSPEQRQSAILRAAKFSVAGLVGALFVGAVIVIVARAFASAALAESMAVHQRQYVTVIAAGSIGTAQPLALPGTLQGGIEATLYARTSGYVVRWTKDIGSDVRKGELLAQISAPEVDQQLSQAVAARAQTASSLSLAKSTAERWQSLRQKDAVTQQDLDERVSNYRQAEANDAAAQANVSRLRHLLDYTQVVAPFDGVVTRRSIDVGDLVDGTSGATGRAMFSVAQVDPLRLYVYVPQAYAHRIKVGDPVNIQLAERAGMTFAAVIARTARAIDATTRTMQVEIRVPNPRGELLAGAFVQVMLPVAAPTDDLVVPTDVLLFRPEGARVAVVDGEGRVTLTTVRLGTDYGDRVEILSGIKPGARLISHPADSLSDGDHVVVVPDEGTPAAGSATPSIAR